MAEEKAPQSTVKAIVDEIDFPPNDYQYYIRDIVIAFWCAFLFLWDWGMDIFTAFNYYYNGDFSYFQLTMAFVIGPSLIMMIITFYWYTADESDSIARVRWIFRTVLLAIQLGPIMRYLEGAFYGWKSRTAWKAGDRENQIRYYKLMLKQDSEAAVTNLAYCFLETAPQLIVQLYILLDITTDEDNVKYQGIWFIMLWISCGSSLVSLSWSVTATSRTNRFIDDKKLNISLLGTLFIVMWQLFVIGARIIMIVLFAKMYSFWVFVFGLCHWIIMFIWIISRRPLKNDYPSCLSCETAFSMVLAGVYNFAFVNDKQELTKFKYLFFHLICFCEEFGVAICWYLLGFSDVWYYEIGYIFPCLMHIIGILFMMMYYGFFHPSKLPLTKVCDSVTMAVDGPHNPV